MPPLRSVLPGEYCDSDWCHRQPNPAQAIAVHLFWCAARLASHIFSHDVRRECRLHLYASYSFLFNFLRAQYTCLQASSHIASGLLIGKRRTLMWDARTRRCRRRGIRSSLRYFRRDPVRIIFEQLRRLQNHARHSKPSLPFVCAATEPYDISSLCKLSCVPWLQSSSMGS